MGASDDVLPANLGVVVVRYLSEHDHEAYIALETDFEAKRYVGGPSTRSFTELKSELCGYVPNLALLAVADSTTDKYIGRCGLLIDGMGKKAELHCLLEQSRRGKHIGELIVRLLVQLAEREGAQPFGIVDPENAPSLKMIQRIEWSQVGVVSKPGKQFNHLIFQPNRGPRG